MGKGRWALGQTTDGPTVHMADSTIEPTRSQPMGRQIIIYYNFYNFKLLILFL